jgi:hypothetical protein
VAASRATPGLTIIGAVLGAVTLAAYRIALRGDIRALRSSSART